jgi:hypothetical protein
MPTYKTFQWNGYRVRIFPEERDTLRNLLFLVGSIAPYFWDSDINMDMIIDVPKSIEQITGRELQYKWELSDSEDKIVKSNQDSYPLSLASERKHRAIRLGSLKPQQCYRLNITITDIYGSTSEPFLVTAFSTKDRDAFKTQIFIGVIVIILGIIFGFIMRGCS